jgi:hypothetical protein
MPNHAVPLLHKGLVPPRGLYAPGRFDQCNSGIPYAKTPKRERGGISRWRLALWEAVGLNGQLIVNRGARGEQPPVRAASCWFDSWACSQARRIRRSAQAPNALSQAMDRANISHYTPFLRMLALARRPLAILPSPSAKTVPEKVYQKCIKLASLRFRFAAFVRPAIQIVERLNFQIRSTSRTKTRNKDMPAIAAFSTIPNFVRNLTRCDKSLN